MSVGPRTPAPLRGYRRYILVTLALATPLAAVLLWWFWTRWEPSREIYPIQGIAVSSAQGEINWAAAKARGVDFAYVHVGTGTKPRDAAFAANWAGARAAGLRYGAELIYDPCVRAGDQATQFITTVPRDNNALPPAIRLDSGSGCNPERDKVLSELNTLINLIEAHSGKPVLLHVSQAFEENYAISEGIDRTLWLNRNFLPPAYATREWVMWTASDTHRVEGIDEPVEWVSVAP